jgi:hypothetical protein
MGFLRRLSANGRRLMNRDTEQGVKAASNMRHLRLMTPWPSACGVRPETGASASGA